MENLNIIIFSKDRACQCYLLLESMKKFGILSNINVLYRYSDDQHKASYDIVQKDFNVSMVCETNFKQNLSNMLFDMKYTMFLVDDIIFINQFPSLNLINSIFSDNDLLAISTRMSKTYNYCYAENKQITIPEFHNNKWTWYGQQGDWGYPMSVDGNIYLTKDIHSKIRCGNFKSPNSLESYLSQTPISKAYMYCFDKPILFNNPHNKVQNDVENRSMGGNYNDLNIKFLNGHKINVEDAVNVIPTSCHYNFEYTLTERT